jgi:pimeloyl-ACP methyl ester carboxylesterase
VAPNVVAGFAEPWSFRPQTLPRGRSIELAGRGTTFVRELPAPAKRVPAKPTVVLLHVWVASGALNWFQVFGPLAGRYRVVAPDLRGHARGLRSSRVFRLADCADDLADTLEVLGTGPVIVAGYSMGGPVAQLFWHRHRDLCAGLVLAATASGFVPGTRERIMFTSSMAAAVGTTRVGGEIASRIPVVRDRVAPIIWRTTGARNMPHWAAREIRRHHWRMILEAGHSLGTYHARWIGDVDVPTAVILTTEDRAVAPQLQHEMARAIPTASVHEIADGHMVCAKPSFVAPFLAAIDDVAARIPPRN